MRGSLGGHILAHVGAVVTEHTDGHRGNLPGVVGAVEPALHLGGGVGWHLVEAVHLGDDALTGAVFLQLVGILGPCVVVGRDDEVLGAFVVVAQPLLHTSLIVDDGQLVVVEQFGSEDGIPVGRTQTIFAEVAVAAFEAHLKLHVGVNDEVFRDRVVLERRDGHGDGVDAADVGVAHHERLGRIIGVLAVDGHVLHVVHVRLLILRLDAEGRGNVHVVDDFLVEAHHMEGGGGALWDGHHAAVGRQVGHAGVIGDADGADTDFAHVLATVVERVERDLPHIVGDVETAASLLRQGEALLTLDGIVERLSQSRSADEGKQRKG